MVAGRGIDTNNQRLERMGTVWLAKVSKPFPRMAVFRMSPFGGMLPSVSANSWGHA